jgi:hypothetical protein
MVVAPGDIRRAVVERAGALGQIASIWLSIRARAIRQTGELLKTFDGRGKSAAAATFSQREMASEAGMSKRQQVTAVRLANVPSIAIVNGAGPSHQCRDTPFLQQLSSHLDLWKTSRKMFGLVSL